MRRKLLILSCLLIALSALTVGTYAYTSRKGSAVSVVTTGNIRIALRGKFGGADYLVMPGTSVEKNPMVKNTGDYAAYVRIQVEKSLALTDPEVTPDVELVEPAYDTEHWIYQDGYYYYCRSLAPGELTEPLFTEIRFLPQMGNAYQGGLATVKLYVQATQTANNGSDPLRAAGWPGKE